MTRALLTAGLLLLLCRPFGPGLSAAAGDAVISLDYRGERLQRLVQDPTLRVFSDGSVLMPQIYAHSKSYRYQMAPDEVQELLDFMQAEGFFGADFVAPRPTCGTARPRCVDHSRVRRARRDRGSLRGTGPRSPSWCAGPAARRGPAGAPHEPDQTRRRRSGRTLA